MLNKIIYSHHIVFYHLIFLVCSICSCRSVLFDLSNRRKSILQSSVGWEIVKSKLLFAGGWSNRRHRNDTFGWEYAPVRSSSLGIFNGFFLASGKRANVNDWYFVSSSRQNYGPLLEFGIEHDRTVLLWRPLGNLGSLLGWHLLVMSGCSLWGIYG